jgi:hypothetical protein
LKVLKLYSIENRPIIQKPFHAQRDEKTISKILNALREILIQGAVLMVGYLGNDCKDRIYFIKTKKVLSNSRLITLF